MQNEFNSPTYNNILLVMVAWGNFSAFAENDPSLSVTCHSNLGNIVMISWGMEILNISLDQTFTVNVPSFSVTCHIYLGNIVMISWGKELSMFPWTKLLAESVP